MLWLVRWGPREVLGATLAAEQSQRQGQLVEGHRKWWEVGGKELSLWACAGKWRHAVGLGPRAGCTA